MKLSASLLTIFIFSVPAYASDKADSAVGRDAQTADCTLESVQGEVDQNKRVLEAVISEQARIVNELEQNQLLLGKLILEMNDKTAVYDKETLRTILEDMRYSTGRLSTIN